MKIPQTVVLAWLMLPAPAFAGSCCKTLEPVGCKDKELLERSLKMSDASDLHAAYEVIKRGVKEGNCRILRSNTLVIESTPDPLSWFAKVRSWGNPDSYWVIRAD